jgi:ClpX C4-type zinc finger
MKTISDRRAPVNTPAINCSFCGKPASQTLLMIASHPSGPDNTSKAYICDECVITCVQSFLTQGAREQ